MIRVVCCVNNNNIGIVRLSNTIFHRNECFNPGGLIFGTEDPQGRNV